MPSTTQTGGYYSREEYVAFDSNQSLALWVLHLRCRKENNGTKAEVTEYTRAGQEDECIEIVYQI